MVTNRAQPTFSTTAIQHPRPGATLTQTGLGRFRCCHLLAHQAWFRVFLLEPKATGQRHRRIEDADAITTTGGAIGAALTLINTPPDFIIFTTIAAAVLVDRHGSQEMTRLRCGDKRGRPDDRPPRDQKPCRCVMAGRAENQRGRISWSKMEVGIARVQQALGISTIPLILPSTGAQLSSR